MTEGRPATALGGLVGAAAPTKSLHFHTITDGFSVDPCIYPNVIQGLKHAICIGSKRWIHNSAFLSAPDTAILPEWRIPYHPRRCLSRSIQKMVAIAQTSSFSCQTSCDMTPWDVPRVQTAQYVPQISMHSPSEEHSLPILSFKPLYARSHDVACLLARIRMSVAIVVSKTSSSLGSQIYSAASRRTATMLPALRQEAILLRRR